MGDCGLDSVGHEGERCLGVCVDPVGGNLVGHDDDGDVQCVATLPALGDLEQRPAADERPE